MIMNTVSFTSPDWYYVKKRVNEMLQNQRDLLEQPATNPEETLIARGRILALKHILNLPQEAELAAQRTTNK